MTIKEKYQKETVEQLKSQLKIKNNLEIPRIEKVVVNVGTGRMSKETVVLDEIVKTITVITGQKPVRVKSKKSISGFKLREGMEVGVKTTLRGSRKWDFIEKVVAAALPRVRDFQGIKESAVDEGGNLNLGIKEQMIFPEVHPEEVKNIFSFQITVVTTAKDRITGLALFRALGFPIAK